MPTARREISENSLRACARIVGLAMDDSDIIPVLARAKDAVRDAEMLSALRPGECEPAVRFQPTAEEADPT